MPKGNTIKRLQNAAKKKAIINAALEKRRKENLIKTTNKQMAAKQRRNAASRKSRKSRKSKKATGEHRTESGHVSPMELGSGSPTGNSVRGSPVNLGPKSNNSRTKTRKHWESPTKLVLPKVGINNSYIHISPDESVNKSSEYLEIGDSTHANTTPTRGRRQWTKPKTRKHWSKLLANTSAKKILNNNANLLSRVKEELDENEIIGFCKQYNVPQVSQTIGSTRKNISTRSTKSNR